MSTIGRILHKLSTLKKLDKHVIDRPRIEEALSAFEELLDDEIEAARAAKKFDEGPWGLLNSVVAKVHAGDDAAYQREMQFEARLDRYSRRELAEWFEKRLDEVDALHRAIIARETVRIEREYRKVIA